MEFDLARMCVQETLSTLRYADRAKQIKNKVLLFPIVCSAAMKLLVVDAVLVMCWRAGRRQRRSKREAHPRSAYRD